MSVYLEMKKAVARKVLARWRELQIEQPQRCPASIKNGSAGAPLGSGPKLDVDYHGVPFRFHFDSEDYFNEVRKNLPPTWRTDYASAPPEKLIHVYWVDVTRWQIPDGMEWDYDPDPDFHGEYWDDVHVVTQRDFVGIALDEKNWLSIGLPCFGDYFDNTFRWFLPFELLRKNTFVLHSCCVVGRDGKARLFLGESGFGKSTVASLAEDRLVLGDDINLLHFRDGRLWAESAFLGGNPKYKAPYGTLYPVEEFYWLQKNKPTSLRAISKSELALRLTMSCFLPGGHCADERLAREALQRVERVLPHAKGFELGFAKDGAFWRLVEREDTHDETKKRHFVAELG